MGRLKHRINGIERVYLDDPRHKMKAKRGRSHAHKVILGQIIAGKLRAWRALAERIKASSYVFPSPAQEDAPITREALENVYRASLALEGKHTPHGWRSALTALAREAKGSDGKAIFSRDAIELTMDQVHDTEIVRAYDRGERLAERAALAQWWDAQLIAVQRGAHALPFQSGGKSA